MNFKRDIIDGPNFPCFSCDRVLFKKQVKILKLKQIAKLFEKVNNPFLNNEVGINEGMIKLIFCHNCHKKITEKNPKLPTIHKSNGLELEEVPEELKLTDLEQQLIALVLVFQKVKKLPVSGMRANFDRVISVPIDCVTVGKTVSELPRHPDDANVVAVQLKRKLEYKNSHLHQYIRPKLLVKAIETLKQCGNAFYQNVTINEDFLNKEINSDDKNGATQKAKENGQIDKQQNQNDQLEKDSEKETESQNEIRLDEDWERANQDKKNEEQEADDDKILPNVKEFQSEQDEFTCLMPRDLSDKIVMNTGKTNMIKGNIKIAPGEGKDVSDLLREEHFDVKAFPKHHPSGHFGLHHARKYKLSPQVYFNQRLLNIDDRFSKDPCYLFMAAYYVERNALERYINISGQRGIPSVNENGETSFKLNDQFDVFKKLKGSPKFWQNARNELVAKVKQLGPFHVFYTFSCGEKRWSEVVLSLLRKKGVQVSIPPNWNGDDKELSVEENGEKTELWEYVNEKMSQPKHKLFKDYIFMITRLFDSRVKSFISNILMGGGRNVPFRYYSYRVEFQARGMYLF